MNCDMDFLFRGLIRFPPAAFRNFSRLLRESAFQWPISGTDCEVNCEATHLNRRHSPVTIGPNKPGRSLLLQRQLGLRRYETAWMLLHKLRRAMVNAAREPLHGDVELDDTWVGGPQAGLRGSRQLKGRKAAIVAVAVENRGRASGRVRMAVIPNFKQTTMIEFVKHHISPGSTVMTDGLKGFEDLK